MIKIKNEIVWFKKTKSVSGKVIQENSRNYLEWNGEYWFEAMDRVWCSAHAIEELLMYHPAIEKAGLTKKLEEVIDKMHDVYQSLGRAEWKEERKKKKEK